MLAILSSRTDVRATAILGMEAPGQLPGTLSQVVQMACNSVSGRSNRLGCVPVISPGMLLRGFAMTTCNSEPWEIL